MNLVIDCNVLVAAGLKAGVCRQVLFHALKNTSIYTCEEILLEYLLVIRREKFSQYKDYLEKLLILFTATSILIKLDDCHFDLPDPSDKKYLSTALSCGADFLITGNLKDFPQKNYHDVRIISPTEYLKTFIQS